MRLIYYCHGRRKAGGQDFEIIMKKRLFFQFLRVKTKCHHFWHTPGKNFGKIPYCPPPGKNPSYAMIITISHLTNIAVSHAAHLFYVRIKTADARERNLFLFFKIITANVLGKIDTVRSMCRCFRRLSQKRNMSLVLWRQSDSKSVFIFENGTVVEKRGHLSLEKALSSKPTAVTEPEVSKKGQTMFFSCQHHQKKPENAKVWTTC